MLLTPSNRAGHHQFLPWSLMTSLGQNRFRTLNWDKGKWRLQTSYYLGKQTGKILSINHLYSNTWDLFSCMIYNQPGFFLLSPCRQRRRLFPCSQVGGGLQNVLDGIFIFTPITRAHSSMWGQNRHHLFVICAPYIHWFWTFIWWKIYWDIERFDFIYPLCCIWYTSTYPVTKLIF